jgi:hypothetical protein
MDVVSVLLIAVFFFIMGAAVVGIIWYMQGVANASRAKQNAGATQDPDLIELTRLYRNRKTQELVVQTEGKNFEGAYDLTESQLRRMNFISGVLIKWLSRTTPLPVLTPVGPAVEPVQQEMPALWPETEPPPETSHHAHVPPFQEEPAQVEAAATEAPPFASFSSTDAFVDEAGNVLEAPAPEAIEGAQPEALAGGIAAAAAFTEVTASEPTETLAGATEETPVGEPFGLAEAGQVEPSVSTPAEETGEIPAETLESVPTEMPGEIPAEPLESVPVEIPVELPSEAPTNESLPPPGETLAEPPEDQAAELQPVPPTEIPASPAVVETSLSDTQPNRVTAAKVSEPVEIPADTSVETPVVEPGEPSEPSGPAESGEQVVPEEQIKPSEQGDVAEPGGSGEPGELSSPVELSEQAAKFVPPEKTDPSEWVKPVSTDLSDMVSDLFNPKPKPVVEFKSIAMQINDILQARLSGTAFESRGISVSDAPDQGVMVALDGAIYSSIRDVPDADVRELLRSCVMEWEKTSKVGGR